MRSLSRFAIHAVCILACAYLVPVSGCAKPQALPKDWPIPQLTLPPQATIVKVTRSPSSSDKPVPITSYSVEFNDPLPPEQVVADIEGKLKQLNYLRTASHVKVPSGLYMDIVPPMYMYVTPDGQQSVMLNCLFAGPRGGKYSLAIFVQSFASPELTNGASPL